MAPEKDTPDDTPFPAQARASARLPPRPAFAPGEDAAARKAAREHKDALVRGVTSIEEMRDAIRRAGRALPAITEVPRLRRLDAALQ